jgi:predicted NAD/FAD-binding protein
MTGRRIAVIGGGVSGITAGYVLSRTDRVTLFEADDRLGGHADTHPTGVDTGFIVYNERTYPLVAAVWSCPTGTALRYPARYLFAFLANHGMLSVSGSPPWRTVTGGSRRYVERAAKRLDEIRLSTPVRAVRLLDRPPTPNATCSAPSPTPRTAPCCTPTPPCCPAARPSARRGTTSSAGASRTARRRASATT